MITITISGPARSGKTAVAYAIKRELECFRATVEITDDDSPHNTYSTLNAQKVVAVKAPHVVITVKELNTAMRTSESK